ncbi:MAG: MarR family winged helix-turn-helix transcriptional regulator [Bacteroidales bacterium]
MRNTLNKIYFIQLMMDGKSVIELIKYYEEFLKNNENSDLKQFSIWLHHKTNPAKVKTPPVFKKDDNRYIVWLVNRISKYFRFYAKRALNANGLSTMDEYYFLISISKLGVPAKNEVYKDSITELNTGTQIMKRLIDMGLIEEIPDEKDKRIRRVKITEKGIKVKDAFYIQSTDDLKLKPGNLTDDDKKELIKHLAYLEKFHNDIYSEDNDKSIEYLLNKYILK